MHRGLTGRPRLLKMSIINSVRFIVRHPLNADRPVRALRRLVLWQIGSRIVPGPVIVPFVDNTVLAAAPGLTSANGNIYTGLYGFEEMGFLLHVLRTSHLFVDVGANVGAYTVLAAGAAGATCICFEPVPSTFLQLQRNLRLNGLENKCEAHKMAVAANEGALVFTSTEGATNHVVLDPAHHEKGAITVPVCSLDGAIGDRNPDIVKIDAEGFETEVLKGAAGILKNPSLLALIIQLNGRGRQYGFNEENLHQTILACGFRPYGYDPFERRLSAVPGKNGISRYTLYCRNIKRIEHLVSTAPKYHVHDQEL
jgi:FkbM family methyltransferase